MLWCYLEWFHSSKSNKLTLWIHNTQHLHFHLAHVAILWCGSQANNSYLVQTNINYNIILQHPIASCRLDFMFHFCCLYAILVNVSLCITICFGITGHLQVYQLLWWRNLLLCYKVVLLFLCYRYVMRVINKPTKTINQIHAWQQHNNPHNQE
jgi:hypothetical protein